MQYKNRYTDKAKQNAYMNACDCLYFGFGKIFWNDCGCNDDSVWDQARQRYPEAQRFYFERPYSDMSYGELLEHGDFGQEME